MDMKFIKLRNPKWYDWIFHPVRSFYERRFYITARTGRYRVPYIPLTITPLIENKDAIS